MIETLQSIKNNIENTDVLSSLTRKDFSAKNIINATRDELPAPSNDFGKALMQDMGASGTIIATYVGDLQQRLIDSTGMFDTGYYCAYDLAFVYYADNSIHIKQVSILNEWSDSSTNDSLYGYVLANHEDKYLIKDGAEIVVPDVSFINPYNKGQKEIELQK